MIETPYNVEFKRLIPILQEQGLVGPCEEIAYGVWLADKTGHGWSTLAREASLYLRGTVQPQIARGGMIWQMGSITGGRIICTDNLPMIRKAQSFCDSLIGTMPEEEIPWSIGGAANRVLRWVTPPQKWVPQYGRTLMFDQMGERDFQYHDCIPGHYEYVYQWDAKAYYWQFLNRLESLYVHPTFQPQRPIIYGVMTDNAKAKWRDAIALMEPGKDGNFGSFYKSFWGTMLGSNPNKPQIIYCRGKKQKPFFRAGVLRPAAMLIARVGHELCHLAAKEMDSVYSTVDSVTSFSPERPLTWANQGLPCRCKYEGDAHIKGRGNWRIGPHATKPYSTGYEPTSTLVTRREGLPQMLYFPALLG